MAKWAQYFDFSALKNWLEPENISFLRENNWKINDHEEEEVGFKGKSENFQKNEWERDKKIF